jgi:hypothetical protein
MPLTTAERQRAYRERHRGEPRGNAAMQAQLAVLQGRVAELEAELAARPQSAPGHLQDVGGPISCRTRP